MQQEMRMAVAEVIETRISSLVSTLAQERQKQQQVNEETQASILAMQTSFSQLSLSLQQTALANTRTMELQQEMARQNFEMQQQIQLQLQRQVQQSEEFQRLMWMRWSAESHGPPVASHECFKSATAVESTSLAASSESARLAAVPEELSVNEPPPHPPDTSNV